MTEITPALIGISLVLAAVFIPMAFFGGSTGTIYRQFSITIVSAMGLSVLVALILTPALAGTLLAHVEGPSGRFFTGFNRRYDALQNRYQSRLEGFVRRPCPGSACSLPSARRPDGSTCACRRVSFPKRIRPISSCRSSCPQARR
jgi:multidrug efflux pump